jgi:hypothetical protein
MHDLAALADFSIRRACGFAGLGIATVMLAMSFDAAAALRTGAGLTALVALALLASAWRAPRRNVRRTELWMLAEGHAAFVRQLPPDRAQALLAEVLRARLLWHAERIGMVAMGLYAAAFATMLAMALRG